MSLEQFPEYVTANLEKDKDYYSMDNPDNIRRCIQDEAYLGECLIVNEKLIWHSVHKYVGKPETLAKRYCIEKDDILQLGRLGFIKAVKRFDTTRGVKFSSFAVTAIVREIRCFLRDSSNIIRPTRTANEILNKIGRVEYDLGFLPPLDDLAVLIDEDIEKVTKAVQIGQNIKYMDEPIAIDGDNSTPLTLHDLLASRELVEDAVLDKVYVDSIIESISGQLTEQEITILRHRIDGLNQTQIAEKEGISQMRVSRVIKKIAKLLSNIEGKGSS